MSNRLIYKREDIHLPGIRETRLKFHKTLQGSEILSYELHVYETTYRLLLWPTVYTYTRIYI